MLWTCFVSKLTRRTIILISWNSCKGFSKHNSYFIEVGHMILLSMSTVYGVNLCWGCRIVTLLRTHNTYYQLHIKASQYKYIVILITIWHWNDILLVGRSKASGTSVTGKLFSRNYISPAWVFASLEVSWI
jgi:hypothetical protein